MVPLIRGMQRDTAHAALAVALMLAMVAPVAPCTTVMLKAKDGCTVIGRTMELGIPEVKSELEAIYLHPRGTPVGTAHGTYNASKYGYLGVQISIHSFSPMLATTEGINEAGLTVSAQTHVQASYESNASTPKATTLFAVQATAFLLACCKTVDEAAKALSDVRVIETPLVGALGALHWSVQDASGASRAFEYVDQQLRVYDNTDVGVFTNDPGYEWHMGNLNFFADYPSASHPRHFEATASTSGPFSSASVPVHGDGTRVTTTTVPATTTHGLNARGLPSSYSPPDRFVKMFLLKQVAQLHDPPATLADGVVAITGLLNTVHIVRGTVSGGGPTPYEYTNWAVLKVPWTSGNSTSGAAAQAGPLFYFRTYDNMQWKRIELAAIDFSPGSKHAPIQLYEPGLGVKDVTPRPRA